MKKKFEVTNENFFDLIEQSLGEALQNSKGKLTLKTEQLKLPSKPPLFSKEKIQKIRQRLNMSQPVFAAHLSCSVSALKAWEQGENRPTGPARRLLQLIEQNPKMLGDKIQGKSTRSAVKKSSKRIVRSENRRKRVSD
jgi:putative transcriptional regulator